MQFDELRALVGALRDRVAELEAKVVALEGRQSKAQVIDSGLPGGRWRVDAVSAKRIEPPKTPYHLTGI